MIGQTYGAMCLTWSRWCHVSCPPLPAADTTDDFFIGQGDINAPKTNANSPRPATTSTSPDSTEFSPTNGDAGKLARSQLLNELSETRPLAKLQEQLEKDDSSDAAEGFPESGSPETHLPTESSEPDAENEPNEEHRSTTPPVSPCKPRRPILNNDDRELVRVSKVWIARWMFRRPLILDSDSCAPQLLYRLRCEKG